MQPWIDAFSLTPTQAQAATTFDRDVSVAAGAGSGKTRTLAARYLTLLEAGYPPRALAAVTFTEKAAREMRNRIRHAIATWRAGACPPEQRPRWAEIEAEIDTARIGTIHALCAALLRAHPAEAGVDPRFEVLDEGLAAALRAQAVEAGLHWAIEQPALRPLFAAFTTTALAAVLTQLVEAPLDAQAALAVENPPACWAETLRAAVRAFVELPAVQSAVADLRVLGTEARLVQDASEKLADQVRGFRAQWAVVEAQLAGGDALSAAQALFVLRREYCDGRSGKKDSVAKAAVKEWREAYDATVQPWLGGASKHDAAPDRAVEARAAALPPLLGQALAQTLQHYQAAKDLRQALDFDDLEGHALTLLRDPDIRARWQAQIAALLVDEFQDTNARQREIVEALAGARGRLFVVGDAKQSIYRFRGADVTVFRALSDAIAARGGLGLALAQTFRAHAGLVAILNALMRTVLGAPRPDLPAHRVPFAALEAQRPAADAKLAPPHLEFLVGLGQNAVEARPAAAHLLAARLHTLHAEAGLAWDAVALLFRASTGFPAYEAAFEAAGIPFVTVAGRGFYERPEIRDVINLLRALADPWDDAALAGALRSPALGLSDASLYRLRWPAAADRTPRSFQAALAGDLAHLPEDERAAAVRAGRLLTQLRGLVDRVPVAELLKALLDETRYLALLAGHPAGPRLRRNLDKLLADAHASRLVRLAEFLEYLQTLQAAGAREGEAPTDPSASLGGGAVRLMTVHKAKGLEFPVVVLADAGYSRTARTDPVLISPTLGLVPGPGDPAPLIHRLARRLNDDQEQAEADRLLYVAATRAREKLIVSGHLSPRAGEAWLPRLAAAAGIDLAALAQRPGEAMTTVLDEGAAVAALAQVTLPSERLASAAPPVASPEAAAPALYRLWDAGPPDDDPEAAPDQPRPRHVTGRPGPVEGALVGQLVHEALRRWRYPGEAGFERLLDTSARALGLVVSAAAAAHRERAVVLLERFRADPRWAELDTAERLGQARHEVQYSLPGQPGGGFIDLLYRDEAGRWNVVDFKTDEVADEADLHRRLDQGYRRQLARYRAAAADLLSQPVAGWLVFLDYAGQVRWEAGG